MRGVRNSIMQNEEFLCLHRYFIWSDRMRVHFDSELKEKKNTHPKSLDVELIMYMSLWYATTYVLIEGWQNLKIDDARISDLLRSKNVGLLKRYRNGVFHFQSKYLDSRFTKFIMEGEDCVVWIRELNKEFSRYFLDELDKRHRNEA
jgi:hypothetical protein